jgi:hypothetical protein
VARALAFYKQLGSERAVVMAKWFAPHVPRVGAVNFPVHDVESPANSRNSLQIRFQVSVFRL